MIPKNVSHISHHFMKICHSNYCFVAALRVLSELHDDLRSVYEVVAKTNVVCSYSNTNLDY